MNKKYSFILLASVALSALAVNAQTTRHALQILDDMVPESGSISSSRRSELNRELNELKQHSPCQEFNALETADRRAGTPTDSYSRRLNTAREELIAAFRPLCRNFQTACENRAHTALADGARAHGAIHSTLGVMRDQQAAFLRSAARSALSDRPLTRISRELQNNPAAVAAGVVEYMQQQLAEQMGIECGTLPEHNEIVRENARSRTATVRSARCSPASNPTTAGGLLFNYSSPHSRRHSYIESEVDLASGTVTAKFCFVSDHVPGASESGIGTSRISYNTSIEVDVNNCATLSNFMNPSSRIHNWTGSESLRYSDYVHVRDDSERSATEAERDGDRGTVMASFPEEGAHAERASSPVTIGRVNADDSISDLSERILSARSRDCMAYYNSLPESEARPYMSPDDIEDDSERIARMAEAGRRDEMRRLEALDDEIDGVPTERRRERSRSAEE